MPTTLSHSPFGSSATQSQPSSSTTYTHPSPLAPQMPSLLYSQSQSNVHFLSSPVASPPQHFHSYHPTSEVTPTASSQPQSYKRASLSHHRRPSTSASTASSPDTIIGHVLIDRKRFRCAKPNCATTVGRLADLRRHWDAHHGGPNREEYYCQVSGCHRSKSYAGGPGRSFGTRKDKRDEHVRNLHREGTGADNEEEE